MSEVLPVIVRGQAVKFDENGLACLNDIWRAAGFRKKQTPSEWRRLPSTHKLTEAVLERITGKSRDWLKSDFRSVVYVRPSLGTFADVRLALAYAEYLNPKLALEVREIFLRYKAADASLADEILEKASPADNEWAGMRALSRATRNNYTDTLKQHGVSAGTGYAKCTNATYQALFDSSATQLKARKGAKRNLRDHMSTLELSMVMTSEALSSERIADERCQGVNECRAATAKSASFIRKAIEEDRKDRRPKML